MKVRDNIAFVVLIISVAAMDSEYIVIPTICCACSLFYLWRRGKDGRNSESGSE